MKKFNENFGLSDVPSTSGASHVGDRLDINILIHMLKSAFCEEMNAWYQYMIVCPFLVGNERTSVQNDFEENAKEELEHAHKLLERINQLGGDNLDISNPVYWNQLATHKYIECTSEDVLANVMIQISAEQGAIETYTRIEAYTRDCDVVTNHLVKGILADEEKHLQEMIEFQADLRAFNTPVAPANIEVISNPEDDFEY